MRAWLSAEQGSDQGGAEKGRGMGPEHEKSLDLGQEEVTSPTQ